MDETKDTSNTTTDQAPEAPAEIAEPREPVTEPAEEPSAPKKAVKRAPRKPRAKKTAAAEPTAGEKDAADDGQDASAESAAPETTAEAVTTDVDASEEASQQTPASGPSGQAEEAAAPATSVLFQAPDFSTLPPAEPSGRSGEDRDESDDEEQGGTNRRSRRRRRRGGTEQSSTGEQAAEADATDTEQEPEEATSRRRRRRRRGDADLEVTDDATGTVTRVRAPRGGEQGSQKVASVKGSTRLEAKRQRRRESRDSGRRRQVITEAEFLARRESVDRQMVVRQADDRIQIGVLEDGVLAEHFVSRTQQDSLIGNVYVGKVQNVLPSMEAAFIDIGRGRNAVLYAGEVNWDAAKLDGQPRRIENALKSGDSVLVQVTKDPVGHKGARLTSQVSLPGRYLVYVPGGSMTGISRKLPDVERNRLKKILKDHLPENAGVIVRTAAEGASEEELMNDINRLRAQWEDIQGKSTSKKTTPPELLYSEPDLTIKVVRDVFNEDFTKLVVAGEEAWDTIEAYVTYVAPDLLERLEKWEADEDIFAAKRIDEQIFKALDRKVFLPSGGSLVIDRTEAMTVIDVNTGKFTGSGGNLEETVTKNNLEAAEEIVRQLRLRDIGGIIVIDFIDMVLESNRDLVLRRLVECLGRDRTKHQVAEVTSLGLVQMTRKRMGTGLLEVFSENCEACAGRGVITHDEPVEHRRSHNSQGEPQQEKSSRRRRKGEKSQESKPKSAQQNPSPDEEAKANATRAAVANIAAAAHAAHSHDEKADEPAGARAERDGNRQHDQGAAPTQPGRAAEPAPTPETEPEAVVEIAGEKVKLPRSRRGRRKATAPTQSPELTLESLTAAFGVTPGGESSEQGRTEQGRTEQGAKAAAPEPKAPTASMAPEASGAGTAIASAATPAPARKRGRGTRAATSAQGSGQTPIERRASLEAEGTAHTVSATAVPKSQDVEQPTMFGVGVPASEL
ncbi:ribonuclease E [Zhihengliuella flava]|uniref:Ribonuclease E n=1 Tax=Zhihengliuella flava TaxID=1285193 RepID=A0A931GEA9_9MICC|nr:Rne/Rng family ribonuclease [Zhihengliuella flava]MBG6083312.1 ribonuclease E [Zhihengliuella flava]